MLRNCAGIAHDDLTMDDKALLVTNCAGNVRGVYEPHDKDDQGKPTWRRRKGGTFLYHLPPGYVPKWAFGEAVGDTRAYFSADSEGTITPLDVREWQDGGEPTISVLANVDTSHAPHMVRLESIYGNLDGGYVRMEKDYDDYPAYENKEDSVFLCYSRGAESWKITKELGGTSTFNTCKSDSVDVTRLKSEMWEDPESITQIDKITWKHVPHDNGYKDDKFPADHSSLGNRWIQKNPQYQSEDAVEWIRAPDLNRDHPDNLFGPVSPSDIQQGKVGNCWLIAAIVCVAEFPDYIQDLIEQKQIAEDGKYSVKLYDVREDKWKTLVIDDLLPCEKRWFWERAGRPLFCQVNADYIWPLIMEKAFAKFCLTYGSLSGGQICWAWQALTGCSDQMEYQRDGNEDVWTQYSLKVERQKEEMEKDRRACPMYGGLEKIDSAQLWELMTKGASSNFLMGASISAQTEKECERPDGLVEGHAYSLLEAVESRGYRFVKLRNPWGDHEWNGDWSDDWDLWREHKDIAEDLNFDKSADGCFWMEFGDFSRIFTRINISNMCMKTKRSRGFMDDGLRHEGLEILVDDGFQAPFSHSLSEGRGGATHCLTSSAKKKKKMPKADMNQCAVVNVHCMQPGRDNCSVM